MLMLLLFIFLGPKFQILPQGRKSAKFAFFQRKSFFLLQKHVKNPNNPLQYHFSNFIT